MEAITVTVKEVLVLLGCVQLVIIVNKEWTPVLHLENIVEQEENALLVICAHKGVLTLRDVLLEPTKIKCLSHHVTTALGDTFV